MRMPEQVLIFPYRIKNRDEIEYAIFLREDLNVWQGIAGGVEQGETPIEAAIRETFKEANIKNKDNFIKLDSYTSMPVTNVTKSFIWGKNVYIIKEYSFGVNVGDNKIHISDEHKKYIWCNYDKAMKMLHWDSNKSALWELNERLKRRNK